MRGEPVSELVQSVLQLIAIDGAGSIAVKVEEDALPILEQFSSGAFEWLAVARNTHLDVFPQTGELGVMRGVRSAWEKRTESMPNLIETNRSAPIGVLNWKGSGVKGGQRQ